MGFDINIDVEFDEKEFRNTMIDQIEEHARDWLETEAGNGHIECDCGARSFDVETWTNADGRIEAAGVCRECNERTDIEFDTAELDSLRK